MTGIYHYKDLDGLCCAWLMRMDFPGCRLIGYDYGEPYEGIIDQIRIGEKVVMADISFPMGGMLDLAVKSRLVWVDHHKSAIVEFEQQGFWTSLVTTYLSTEKAACEILFDALVREREEAWDLHAREVVKLLGTYDVFRGHGDDYWVNDVLPFQYGMRSRHFHVDGVTDFSIFTPEYIAELKDVGRSLIAWDRSRHRFVLKSAYEGSLGGELCLFVNTHDAGTTFFESLPGYERYPVLATYYFNGDWWKFSIRGNNFHGVDCGAIAKAFGGGGHVNAAGFRVKSLNEVFKNL